MKPPGCEIVQCPDSLYVEPATVSLVGESGKFVAVAYYDLPGSERGSYDLFYVRGASRQHQQQLGFHTHVLAVQHHAADRFTERCPAGLTRQSMQDSRTREPLRQHLRLCALSASLSTFQNNKEPALHHTD